MVGSYKTTTLKDAVALAAVGAELDDAYPKEVWAAEAEAEYRAEHDAEMAWLRAAENAGWEEALLESYVESGFISRY